MYRFIGASSSRWGLLIPQLEDVRWVREAPTFLFSGGYVAARRRHTLMMLIPDGKGRERLYEACRIKRWVAPKGKQTTKYPAFETLILEDQYVALTTRSGQVCLCDGVAEFYHPELPLTDVVDELLVTIDECPLAPSNAVEQLAALYGSASAKAMRKELWLRHEKIEAWREEPGTGPFGPTCQNDTYRTY